MPRRALYSITLVLMAIVATPVAAQPPPPAAALDDEDAGPPPAPALAPAPASAPAPRRTRAVQATDEERPRGQAPAAYRVEPAPPARTAAPVLVRPAPLPGSEPSAWNGVHFNPLALVQYVVALGYERVFTRNLSVLLQFEYLFDSGNGSNISGYGVGLQPHFYFLRPAPGGLYLAPALRLAYVTGAAEGVQATGAGYAFGATVGWSWVWGAFNLKLGGGVQYLHIVATATNTAGMTVTVGAQGVAPAGDLSLGLVF